MKQSLKVKSGSILIAKPFWEDNIYKRSVIYITDHDREKSIGLIINKLSNLSVHSALVDLNIQLPLLFGGQSGKKFVNFIHSYPEIPDSIYMSNDIYIGGDYEFIRENINAGRLGLEKIRFFAGNVLWRAGQLENEIIENKWWVDELCAEEYFPESIDSLWASKLMCDGHVYGIFDEYPDPSIN